MQGHIQENGFERMTFRYKYIQVKQNCIYWFLKYISYIKLNQRIEWRFCYTLFLQKHTKLFMGRSTQAVPLSKIINFLYFSKVPFWKNNVNLNQENITGFFLFILVYFGKLCRYNFGILWYFFPCLNVA
jgi:hypothetical protein